MVVVRGQGVNLNADHHLTPSMRMSGVISTPSACPLDVDRHNFTFFTIDAGLLCKVKLSVTVSFF